MLPLKNKKALSSYIACGQDYVCRKLPFLIKGKDIERKNRTTATAEQNESGKQKQK